MHKLKKLISITLALALFIGAAAFQSSAVLGDGDALSVKIDLQIGRYVGGTADANWVPIAAGQTLAVDDVITVRIAPESDFLCGVTRYITMFSTEYFEIVGSGNSAFTPNANNAFYAAVAPADSGWSGATDIPKEAWPTAMQDAEYLDYTAVAVNNKANSSSPNGGYPEYMPGDWLFRFDLKVIKAVTSGSDARIWMDSRWVRNPDDITLPMYFTKLFSRDDLSSTGFSHLYSFDVDLTDADVTLPLPGAGLLGDVNGDGNITVADALMALRGTTGELALTGAQQTLADVNRDGFITVADALMILRYTTGEIVAFP
jgi:hypothetical protein